MSLYVRNAEANAEVFLGVKTVCACRRGLTRSLHMELDFTLSVRKHAVPPPLRIHFTECTLQAGGVRVSPSVLSGQVEDARYCT